MLATAAVAVAAPAGDEYLPKVPKSAGKGVVAGGGDSDPGATILAPEVRDRDQGETGGKKAKKAKKATESDSASAPLAATASSDDDDSGGALDTLFDPVVLLLVVGVVVTAVGMTMRRRQAVAGEPEAKGSTRELGAKPPPPDGEIIGREPPA